MELWPPSWILLKYVYFEGKRRLSKAKRSYTKITEQFEIVTLINHTKTTQRGKGYASRVTSKGSHIPQKPLKEGEGDASTCTSEGSDIREGDAHRVGTQKNVTNKI